MKILLVAATVFEVNGFLKKSVEIGVPFSILVMGNIGVDVLVTGVGAVPTTFHLTRFALNYDFIINVGIAGSFTSKISLGQVAIVESDCFGDYGIDDNGSFIPLSLAGLALSSNSDLNSLSSPLLNNFILPKHLQRVKGITMSTVSGSEGSISRIRQYWNPDVETMESAAVFYVCLLLKKPFLCLRAISNFVEPRDKSKWKMKEAIENLHQEVINIISILQEYKF